MTKSIVRYLICTFAITLLCSKFYFSLNTFLIGYYVYSTTCVLTGKLCNGSMQRGWSWLIDGKNNEPELPGQPRIFFGPGNGYPMAMNVVLVGLLVAIRFSIS